MSIRKINEYAMPYVTNFHTYIDIGAHDGDTAVPMLGTFKRIYAFEPNPESVKSIPETIKVFDYALGNKNDMIPLTIPNNGKNDYRHGSVVRFTEGITSWLVEQKTLDSFNIDNIGFIKIDVEGAEPEVIEGSLQTLMRCKPVVMFESKVEWEAREAINLLRDIGYTIKRYKGETVAYYD